MSNLTAFKLDSNFEAMAVSLPLQDSKKALAQVFVCLPCYNEAQNIPKLLTEIHSTFLFSRSDALELQSLGIEGYRILAVNDGSTDCTEMLLKNFSKTYPVTVVSHRRNQGLAETYRTLINSLKEQAGHDDIAVFMDADNTHHPHVIKDLVKVASTSAEVAIASRYRGGLEIGVPFRRRLLSKVVNWLIRNLCGISVLDCTSGYRAYQLEVLESLPPLESKGFEVTAEILVGISEHKPPYRIKEIPLTLYYDRKRGPSKIHVGQTITAYIRLLRRHSKIAFTPFVRRTADETSQIIG